MFYDALMMTLGFLVHTGLSFTSQSKFKSLTMWQHIKQDHVAFITSGLAIASFTLIGGDTMSAALAQYFPIPEGRRLVMFVVGLSLNSILKKLCNLVLVKKGETP